MTVCASALNLMQYTRIDRGDFFFNKYHDSCWKVWPQTLFSERVRLIALFLWEYKYFPLHPISASMWSDFSPESRALSPSGVNRTAPGGVGWGATRRPCWFLFGLSLPQAGAACHIRKVYFPTSEQSTSFVTRCAELNLREKHRERRWPNDSTSKTPTAIIQRESDHNFWHVQTPFT